MNSVIPSGGFRFAKRIEPESRNLLFACSGTEAGAPSFSRTLREGWAFNLSPRRHNSRYPLQIVDDFHVVPSRKQVSHPLRNRPADLHHQPATRLQNIARLWNQPFDHFQPGRSREHSTTRFELSHLKLDCIFLRLTNVRRIGNDEVKVAMPEFREKVSVVKLDTTGQLMPRGVSFSNF